MTAKLTLGPILFNWIPEQKRDFYFKIADEAPVDVVYVGEVVCTKRLPTFLPYIDEIVRRLKNSGKEVVLSTLALFMDQHDLKTLQIFTQKTGVMIEANDLSCSNILKEKPHCIGPFVNIYNEYALSCLAKKGAVRVTLPYELPNTSIAELASQDLVDIDLEVQVFGRTPLAISARCNHARAYDLHKSNCELICKKDPDGMTIKTLDDTPFLALNGLQTMSYSYTNLLNELPELKEMGVDYFRLSPHNTDMVTIAQLFRDALDNRLDTNEANTKLQECLPDVTFSNGFYHGKEGYVLV